MAHIKTIALLAGIAAAATFTATPAQAADLATSASSTTAISAAQLDFGTGGAFDTDIYRGEAEASEYHRRRYRRYRRGRIRGGDVLAGVLVLGGIAAIASAASNNNRERERYRDRRYERRDDDNRRYDDRRRSNPRSSSGSGLDSAVSQCMGEIERDVRVDSVDNASRTASGWTVSGTLFNGSGFTCQIDNDGRISNIDYSGFSDSSLGAADGQYSDQSYADARAAVRGQQAYQAPAPAEESDEPLPAYPGGPLPGEETYSD
ncbi:hypothetical protein [uncultured Erythrobacter sp.]|uniref:hypothetical protein n=1 Tax=uncultured Erythrobacter sp. TaxID=263913 RepID=UPI0026123187|nr:hypothetical protein [uncultured Erythrobacter sp.]